MRIIGRSFFSSPDVDPVLATYRNTVASLGLTFREPVEVPTWTVKDGSLAMNRLLESDHPPGAVIGATDALALGAVRAAKEHGLAIGSDIAITGYSETDVSSLAEPGQRLSASQPNTSATPPCSSCSASWQARASTQ